MVSPDDLLIFKVRAGVKKGEEENKPAAAGQAGPQPQQIPVKEAEQTKPQPIPVKEAEQTVQARPQPQQIPVRETVRPEVRAPEQIPTYQAERARPFATELPAEEMPEAAAGKKAVGAEDIKGKFCAWHAWRPAYAVCSYCHRPFCYEDIEEFDSEYYCLEDIDKVSRTHAEAVYTKYTNISLVSAAMLMLAFAVFILFANAQLAYVINAVRLLGARTFISELNASYEILFIETALTVVSLASAIMIVMQSKRAYGIGTVACIGDIALFSYLFLGSGTLYIAVIAVVSFAGLVSLAYSRVSYSANEEETPFADISRMQITGVQKF
jgi:hypothetical protein